MLAVTEPGVRKITAMVATQLLKTTLIENIVGYHIHLDPCPMLIVQPKDASALQFSKERVAPFIKATPVLRRLVGTSKKRRKRRAGAGKSRDAGETIDYKAFPGGFVGIVGAGSPDNLARRPIRIILFDEVDKYLPIKEGNPIVIGEERLATFDSNSLSVAVCSPTITGESKIEDRHAQSDQRRASVECPLCGHRMFPEFFRHVDWSKGQDGKTHRPETAAIYCEACEQSWTEGQRLRSLSTIRWHQTRSFECCGELQKPLDAYAAAWRVHGFAAIDEVWDWWKGPRWEVYRAKCRHCAQWTVPNEHAGFQAGKLYSPWSGNDSPAKMAGKWLEAKDEDGKLSFYNTQLALTYRKNTGKQLDADTLLTRREVWAAEVPDGVAIITVGIDVQDYRIELEVVGWGRDEESWSIAYEVIDGEFDDPKTQELLDEFLQRRWVRADGRPFAVTAACIDSGGHHTTAVYNFSKARLGRFIWAIKGESARTGQRNPLWPTKRPMSRTKKTFRPVIIGVNDGKDTVRSYLGKEKPGPGYMHFTVERDANYFAQLTSERIEIKELGGHKYRVWVLPEGKANEALDCRVYAYAALHGLMHRGTKLNREADRVGAVVTATNEPSAEPAEDPTPSTPPMAAPQPPAKPAAAAAAPTPPPAPAAPRSEPKMHGRSDEKPRPKWRLA